MIKAKEYITVKNARVHNLKGVSVRLPKYALIVFSGLSGSGKSSLAFDTIYSEGQRRYVESLSTYARQFLEVMQKPDVESISGLSPAISIEQKAGIHNPRSTVGTVTEIHDYMRLLWARVGVPYSPITGKAIASQSVEDMKKNILNHNNQKNKQDIMLLAPIVRERKGQHSKILLWLKEQGWEHIRIDGRFYHDKLPILKPNVEHRIDVVIDTITQQSPFVEEERLSQSLEQGLALSDGLIFVEPPLLPDGKTQTADFAPRTLSSRFSCPESGFTIEEMEPRFFSFNNPKGACETCSGLGVAPFVDEVRIIPDKNLSLLDASCIAAPGWSSKNIKAMDIYQSLAKHYNVHLEKPFKSYKKAFRDALLHGTEEGITFHLDDGQKILQRAFEGIIPNIERRIAKGGHPRIQRHFAKMQSSQACASCGGCRLKKDVLQVRLMEKNIAQVSSMTIHEAIAWFQTLEHYWSNDQHQDNQAQRTIALLPLKEIIKRLGFLKKVGLHYLSLDRVSHSLSGGEAQRIRLASQIGSGLTGVLYVLDEPSIGLHQRDNAQLIETLRDLQSLGNTVIVVEHDEETLRAADYLVDIGPKAGIDGGSIVAQGSIKDLQIEPLSITGAYLSGKACVPLPLKRRSYKKRPSLIFKGISGNNLNIDHIAIPTGILGCVTGVSGSGKSTLLLDTLYAAGSRILNKSSLLPAKHESSHGWEHIDRIIHVTQSPIGRTPRSNPATYTGVFTPIREWMCRLPQARARGYTASRFSFNLKGGRCDACDGDGVKKISMHFLADVFVDCSSCKGKRYNKETLEVTYDGHSIADILNMTVAQALEVFRAIPSIRDKLQVLMAVGLGYITLGQRATTLSGGEAQRIKLSRELAHISERKTLYILDEPTTGLHMHDVAQLMVVLQMLVERGHTVLLIEHNLDVIKTADWILDLGPEGGPEGGKIVSQGTPEDISKNPQSYTGHFLKKILRNNHDKDNRNR